MSLLKQTFPGLNLQLYVHEAGNGPQWGIQCVGCSVDKARLSYQLTLGRHTLLTWIPLVRRRSSTWDQATR